MSKQMSSILRLNLILATTLWFGTPSAFAQSSDMLRLPPQNPFAHILCKHISVSLFSTMAMCCPSCRRTRSCSQAWDWPELSVRVGTG